MRRVPQVALLSDGRRLHLQDGPIDLVIQAWGSPDAVRSAYAAAVRGLDGLLDRLCAELPALRHAARPDAPSLTGSVARRMGRAVAPFADEVFITPMAAVAGSVADHVLASMIAAGDLARAYVNNGGDIALHCGPGERLTVGVVDRPDQPTLFDSLTVDDGDGVHGIATSGWRGRSFSLGIADSVTVLARSAAAADAAATVVANAVDLPDHPGVERVPAESLQPDSDLGALRVTCGVPDLSAPERGEALRRGLACAAALLDRDLIGGVVLRLQGEARTLGIMPPAAGDRAAFQPNLSGLAAHA